MLSGCDKISKIYLKKQITEIYLSEEKNIRHHGLGPKMLEKTDCGWFWSS
jgi:hypothetical protein